MRTGWFGDRYDLLKWSIVLRHTAEAQAILYVAMLRDNAEKPRRWKSCDPQVVDFFKVISPPKTKQPLIRILELDSRIKLFSDALPNLGPSRVEYFAKLKRLLDEPERASYCVFLDPDTGLAQKSSGEHVGYAELQDLWASLRSNDKLIVYQHGWRPPGGEWHSIAHERFAATLDLPVSSITQEPKEKTNVAFLIATKD